MGFRCNDAKQSKGFCIGVWIAAAILASPIDMSFQQGLRTSSAASGSQREKEQSNWVVVTTLNHTTESIRTLAEVPGWKVVVVADGKTPKDWELDNVIYLDMEKQRSLGYKVLPLLPYNHFG